CGCKKFLSGLEFICIDADASCVVQFIPLGAKNMQKLLSIAEVSRSLGTNENKILNLIRSGELSAINVAQNGNGKRPRWRIAGSDLDAFLESRKTATSPQVAVRKTRRTRQRVFFPS
ncbi:MAG: helix-turn-helix domain-containing protein, partial [Pirellula sp.]